MYDRYLSPFLIPQKQNEFNKSVKKIKKFLLAEEKSNDYIVSYVSYTHMHHSMLCISKKDKDNNYYVVNTIGIMNIQNHFADPDIRAVHELINPNRSQVCVYAKHYEINNNTADTILKFIQQKHGKGLLFFELKKNCHNFATAILEENGVSDRKLYDSRFPLRAEKMRCELSRVIVPDNIRQLDDANKFRFYGSNGSTAINNKNDPALNTWKWNNDIKITHKLSYIPENKYYEIIKKTPISEDKNGTEQIKLKKAIQLLENYSEGSLFWHPLRTYRTLVRNIIVEYKNKENSSVSQLLDSLREGIRQYHKTNGDISYIRGSLHRRLRFIDFVLNDANTHPTMSREQTAERK